METRTYGRLWLDGGEWKMTCEPHVAMWAKRIFQRIPAGAHGTFRLSHNPATCLDLQWLMQRFPLDVADPHELETGAKAHTDRIARLNEIIDPNYKPQAFAMVLPPREYQRRAADLYLASGSLLIADELGLGKTCTAICSLTDPKTLPVLIVCLTHLPAQWAAEIKRFMPELRIHVTKKKTPYELPKFMGQGPDVVICPYSKLSGWATVLGKYCRSVVFDEVQELRHGTDSMKGAAAKHVADAVQYRCGLSATPIYNFGGEIFNVLDVLSPGSLGTKEEFEQEWCIGYTNKKRLKDPDAFGSWLRESHLMIRRTRRDVGRELPVVQKLTHEVDCDTEALKKIEGNAGELARIILAESGTTARGEKMQAAEEFSNILRQATGIAKAPYVAEFVRMLLENGEPVVLFGWHRSVYEIWLEKLKDFRPAMYTGSETAAQKQDAAWHFNAKRTDLLIMSLRSGAGVDGLQKRCRTTVIGELDWSPGVIEQCIGRVYRDGQPDPVTAYLLLSDGGIDPFMAETLGLKRDQVEGIRGREPPGPQRVDDGTIKRLAEAYLSKRSRA